jgi:hypothetical protein
MKVLKLFARCSLKIPLLNTQHGAFPITCYQTVHSVPHWLSPLAHTTGCGGDFASRRQHQLSGLQSSNHAWQLPDWWLVGQ